MTEEQHPGVLIKKFINKIHLGDSLEVMNMLPASSIDLIVTSPPYNIRNSSGGGMRNCRTGKWPNAKLMRGYDGHDDNMPYKKYVLWQRECLAGMMRVLSDDGAIFYNHKWRVQNGILQDRKEILEGFPVRQIIIWERCGGINFNSGYFLPKYEVIYLICNKKFRLAPKKNSIGDVWKICQEKNNTHPAPFPVALAKRCIEATSSKIILDPFMGSGTTAIAAELCSRDWIGIESSINYLNNAEERIEQARIFRR